MWTRPVSGWIETLPQTITAANPDRYPTPITAHDYLHERLVDIGLIPARP